MTDQRPRKRAESPGSPGGDSGSESETRGRRRPSTHDVVRKARAHVDELLGRPAEGISGLRRTDDGWQVRVDVVEMRRVPDTTSLLATYELDLDRHCELVGYRRVARFRRSDTGV